jgi:hypothetical protein
VRTCVLSGADGPDLGRLDERRKADAVLPLLLRLVCYRNPIRPFRACLAHCEAKQQPQTQEAQRKAK